MLLRAAPVLKPPIQPPSRPLVRFPPHGAQWKTPQNKTPHERGFAGQHVGRRGSGGIGAADAQDDQGTLL